MRFGGFADADFAAYFFAQYDADEEPLPPPATTTTSSSSSSPSLKPHTYNPLYQVGVGAYGAVFKAKCEQTGDIVALKKVKLDASQKKHGFPLPAVREIKYLAQARHENSVKLLEILRGGEGESAAGGGEDASDLMMTLVFEYVESDLCGYLSTNTKLTEMHRLCIMKQLLDGLFYAHVNSICHRDLKPSNILVTGQGVVKLGDWGMCRQVLPNRTYTNEVVTLWYRAPELVLGSTQYGTEIDMWALGCVFAELYLSGHALIRGADEDEQLRLTVQLLGGGGSGAWPAGWDALPRFPVLAEAAATVQKTKTKTTWEHVLRDVRPSVRKLLAGMLAYDSKARLTANEALDDDVFWGADDVFACQPNMLPTPRGDGVHEFQLRAQEQQQKAADQAKRRRMMAE